MELTAVSAIYGKYDPIPPVPVGFDYAVMVTDEPMSKTNGWTNIVFPSKFFSPRLAAKLPKCRPDLFSSTQHNVWVDGTLRDPNGWLAKNARKMFEDGDEFIVWEHPWRNCLFDEATFCLDVEKYKLELLKKVMQEYSNEGMPKQYGLYACGAIGLKTTQTTIDLGNEWLTQSIKNTIQDQVTLPYILWKRNIAPAIWPGAQYQVVGWDAAHH